MYNNTHEGGIRRQAAPSGVTYGQSTASGPAPTTAGHHKHDILNKVDPRIDSTHDHQPMAQPTHNIPEGTYGPHKSRIANALDPRVDSDLDSRRAHDGGMGSQAVHAQTGHHHHNAGVGGIGAGGGLMGTGTMGAGYGAEHNTYGTTAGVGGGAPEGTYGPHTSRLGNAADPRVDSDRDHRHAGAGVGHHNHHQAGMMGGGGVNQPTATQMAGTGVGAGGPMTAAHTLGPHKSDLMNKLDPRVDSKTGQMKGGAGAGRGTY
ncbi:hypothetical protein B0J18DRAFT_292881 [Chaetomium sp. MPI-SDFR-AT-0129]|nr:hypothetical protein B0J18DRAFT_292881 [Chaetomium sp. MPI-SDFR-AT-0129]